ncbi:MAG TPA: flagellin [Candidatus Sulfotelmatobacter sp.]|nr:flagellin [Candidatus Sulfotelmatobacter sp.]
MSFGIGSLTSQANQALTPLEQIQKQLLQPYTAAATGRRVTSPFDDPAGYAIATELQTQAGGFDAGSQNALDAGNALNIAQGALATTRNALQSLRSLAVSASNDLLSPADRQDLQTVANQLVQQVNTDAQNANFNGVPLLNGTYGSAPATPADATVTANAALAGGGNLVASAASASGATAGTIQLSVVDGAGGAAVDVTFTDTATGATTNAGQQAPGATFAVDGTTVTLGNATAQDAGSTATVQVQAAAAGSTAPDLNVQTGANEGDTTGVTTPNAGANALFLQNVDLSTGASSQNAIGQIDEAVQATVSAGATLGAQQVAIQNQIGSNNTAANALTASAADITDASAAQTSTELYQLITQQQISLLTLQNANSSFGFLNRFLNTAV